MKRDGHLTDESNWRWNNWRFESMKKIRRIANDRHDWVHKARSFYTGSERTFIELGAAPGRLSSYLTVDTELQPYGVDFSDDADLYVETMKRIGKSPTLYKEDVFAFDPGEQFDIVASCGLVEHFYGESLDRLLKIHDKFVKPGGLLIVQMPNFTGLNYYWHNTFNKPGLDKHNLEVMYPKTFDIYRGMGYETLFSDYIGQFRIWGASSYLNASGGHTVLSRLITAGNLGATLASRILLKVGIPLQGPNLSTWLLYVGRKPH